MGSKRNGVKRKYSYNYRVIRKWEFGRWKLKSYGSLGYGVGWEKLERFIGFCDIEENLRSVCILVCN